MQKTRGYPPSPRAIRLPSTTAWILLAALSLAIPAIAHAQSSLLAEAALPSAPAPAYKFETLTGLTPFGPAPSGLASSLDASSQEPAPQQTPDTLPPVTERIKIEPPSNRSLRHVPGSEIGFYGMYSYGNWQLFAAGIHEHLYTAGFEYYRHTWGYFAGAQMDYAAEFLPVVFLRQPRILNPFGVRRSRPGDDVIVPGLAFSPIGLRMEWRHTKTFKPYFNVMGGAIGFTQKALSPDASYYDFTLHESIGFYYKMTERVDMRVALFSDFHFSNAYITDYNPGLDVMNSQLGVSYHFGKDDPEP